MSVVWKQHVETGISLFPRTNKLPIQIDMGRNNNTNQKTIKAIDGGCKPIHSPGLIQPHGVLLVLNEPELAIQQVSRNTLQFLGLRPRELLNKKLEELIDAQQIEIIKQALKDNFERINPLVSLMGQSIALESQLF